MAAVIRYFNKRFFDIIAFSALLLFFRLIMSIGSSLFVTSIDSLFVLLYLATLLITFLQLYSLFRLKKYAWIFSLFQMIGIFAISIGSFGYIFDVIFKSRFWDQQTHNYLMSGWLVLSESFKTFWIYRNVK